MYIIGGLFACFLYMVSSELFSEFLFNWRKPEKLTKELKKTNSRVLIGKSEYGLIYHNFLKFPHMVVAGTTGYGKTNFIRSLVQQVAGDVIIIDLKGTDDYPYATARTIPEAVETLKWVEENLRKKRKRHIYIVVDEAAQFMAPSYLTRKEAADWYYCQKVIHDVATLGRSLKIHLIYATQYPTADVVPGHIKQNCECRVVFRLPTEIASRVALDEEGANELPGGVCGRAIYKTDRKIEVQTYQWEVEDLNELSFVKNLSPEKSGAGHSYEIG